MTITYETLFEILRKEKNHEDLQKLDDTFFKEVKDYIEDKNKVLNEKPRLDQFMDGYENEQNAVKIQLQNIKKLVKDIFERRERKIIDMALNKAKTGSNIVDTSALLPEEKGFFKDQIDAISGFRMNILEPVLLLKPQIKAAEQKDLNMPSKDENIGLKKVQILESLPKFVGVDLEIYGPFENNEEVELSPEIAEMLIKTNKARII